VHFLTKDMGEDRWLCTLLVLAGELPVCWFLWFMILTPLSAPSGWRLDYCATSYDETHCPLDFDEFWNQRRSVFLPFVPLRL
jgi:chitin synthase